MESSSYSNDIAGELSRIKDAKENIRNAINKLGRNGVYDGLVSGTPIISDSLLISEFAQVINNIKYGIYFTSNRNDLTVYIGDAGDITKNSQIFSLKRNTGSYGAWIKQHIFVNKEDFSLKIVCTPSDNGAITVSIGEGSNISIPKSAITEDEELTLYSNNNFATTASIISQYSGSYVTPYNFANDRGFAEINITIMQNM